MVHRDFRVRESTQGKLAVVLHIPPFTISLYVRTPLTLQQINYSCAGRASEGWFVGGWMSALAMAEGAVWVAEV